MMKRLFVLASLFVWGLAAPAGAACCGSVEIYSPQLDEVVKTMKMTPEIETTVIGWLKTIDSVYVKCNPDADSGSIVRFFFEPAVTIRNEYLDMPVSEVCVAVPETDPPFYIIRDGNALAFYPFNGSLKELSELLDYQICKQP